MNQDIVSFLSIMIGVITSSLYEPAFEFMFPKSTRSIKREEVWNILKPYVMGLLSAIIIAIVVLAFSKATGVEIASWWQAFLVGFGINKGLDIFNDFRRIKA